MGVKGLHTALDHVDLYYRIAAWQRIELWSLIELHVTVSRQYSATLGRADTERDRDVAQFHAAD